MTATAEFIEELFLNSSYNKRSRPGMAKGEFMFLFKEGLVANDRVTYRFTDPYLILSYLYPT